MIVKDELKEIRNKDLTTMGENELKEYRAYLDELYTNAEDKVNLNKRKYIANFGGLALSLVICAALAYGMYSLYNAMALKKLLAAYIIVTCLCIVDNIIQKKYKNAKKDCRKIKETCNDKLMDVERQLAKLGQQESSLN